MRLGRYTLLRRVGAGGMAEVWKAKVKGPAGFEKTLAIKRILPDRLTEQEYVDLFIDEAKLVAKLHHPNIVQVFDFGVVEPNEAWETDTEYYMAMEYIPGANLREITRRLNIRKQPWPIELAVFITLEVSKALSYAHGAGIIHRDVSPHNVLVAFDGRVKVTDFGIARVEDMLPRTAEGIRRGKISYMSPEQVDLRGLDGRSDIFSLGAVCYELATGSKLFEGVDKPDIARKIRTFDLDEAPKVDLVRGDLVYILRKAMHLDPRKRFQDAAEMEHELHEVLGTSGVREAPVALASLIRGLFEEEYLRETVVDEQDFDPTRVQPAPDLGGEPSQPSGGTLISSAANVIIEDPPVEGGTEKAPWEQVSASSHNLPAAKTMPMSTGARLVLYALASVFLIGVGVVLANIWPSRDAPVATATPTQQARRTRPPATRRPTRVPGTKTPPAAVTRAVAPPTARPAAQVARVSVAARPWAEIWIDGQLVKAETPLRKFRLAPGYHVIEARHPKAGKMRKRVNLKPGQHLRLFVNVPRKRIETR